MPHITVDYSDVLTDTFDRRGFGQALHPLVARAVDGSVTACKTRFRRADECVIADGETDIAMVHVEVALLSGRTPEVKGELSRSVLRLLRGYVEPTPGHALHASVDVSELDRGCYSSRKYSHQDGHQDGHRAQRHDGHRDHNQGRDHGHHPDHGHHHGQDQETATA
jgi:5-carboxymethyl-2-hydroxymuconate isomerase